MGNRSIRDEKQGRAGAPGAGSLFGKKTPPRRAGDPIAPASQAEAPLPREDKSLRRRQLDRIEKSFGI